MVSADDLLRLASNPNAREWREAIGLVCMNWSLLDLELDVCTLTCLHADGDLVDCLSQQMQLMTKTDALSAMLHRGWPELAEPFKQVANYIRETLVPERNIIVHGIWLPSKGIALVSKKSAKGKLILKDGSFSPARIQDFATAIADVVLWLQKLESALPASRSKPSGRYDKNQAQVRALRKAQALPPLPS